jgi:4-amino-4-deoxy-L-arabinose transferase-like glycosyltransferase
VTAVTAGRPARLRAATGAQARWTRPALSVLLAATALLYLAGLSRNGWANDFYSAAVQAGAKSWKAFFFGSFDASNFITVDKTPASLWVMELSARLFGLNYWSVLVPQALEGVGSVALLYGAVRRWFGPGAGLLAGSALALTPVATLMFRFNNPDALLVLLMTGAAYGVVRAIESGRTRWLVLAGTLLGFGFLTKMLQAFLLLPAFGIAYLVAGPPRLGVRIWQLLAGLAAVIVSAGWWVAAVMLTPAADRPYIGGSTSNSILQLALGYNGLGRIDGNETGSVGFTGNRGGGPAFSGPAGLGRLFASEMGGQISWLLPAALLAIGALAWLSWRARRGAGRPVLASSVARSGPGAAAAGRRTDVTMAAVLLWGGWLVVTGAVFSFMAGIIHPYYTVALAPAIAALVGIGAVSLWHARDEWPARALLAAGVAITAGWSYALLDRSPSWYPPLRFAVVILGFGSAAALLAGPWLTGRTASAAGRTSMGDGRAHGLGRGLGRVSLAGSAAAVALIAALAGPAAYSLDAAATAHTGALPTAGPTVTSAFGGPGGGGTGGAGGPAGLPGAGRGSGSLGGTSGGAAGAGGGRNATGAQPPGSGSSGSGSSGIGGSGQASGTGSGTARLPGAGTRAGSATGRPGGSPGGGQGLGGGGGRGGGGLGGSTQVSKALMTLLERDASAYTWAAATVGSESAAPLQLATGQPVMSIGGFNGTDPSLSLAQFKRLVAEHKIHYFVGANSDSFGGGSGDAAAISTWVTAHFKSQTVGGETVYNLTEASSAG